MNRKKIIAHLSTPILTLTIIATPLALQAMEGQGDVNQKYRAASSNSMNRDDIDHSGMDHSMSESDSSILENKVISGGTDNFMPLKKFDLPAPEVRLHCRVSHISYNDSIVYPNQKGKAHLHMFIGNTITDENTTDAEILRTQGKSTCEGGTVDKSAYWIPAVLNEKREFVNPKFIKVYYKSLNDKEKVNEIPNNYQVIGSQKIEGCGKDGRLCAWTDRDNDRDPSLQVRVNFPNCLRVDGAGEPVLKSTNNDHAVMGFNSCPNDYPYRIPTISINFNYDIRYDSDWVLSSDIMDPENPKPKGSTIHGDVITSWDDEARKTMLTCIKKDQHCAAVKRKNEDKGNDFNLEGEKVYKDLVYIGDTTPFGVTPAMATDHSTMTPEAMMEEKAVKFELPKVEDTATEVDKNSEENIALTYDDESENLEDESVNLEDENEENEETIKELREAIEKLNERIDRLTSRMRKFFRM